MKRKKEAVWFDDLHLKSLYRGDSRADFDQGCYFRTVNMRLRAHRDDVL